MLFIFAYTGDGHFGSGLDKFNLHVTFFDAEISRVRIVILPTQVEYIINVSVIGHIDAGGVADGVVIGRKAFEDIGFSGPFGAEKNIDIVVYIQVHDLCCAEGSDGNFVTGLLP